MAAIKAATAPAEKAQSKPLQWPRERLLGGFSRPIEFLVNIYAILIVLLVVVYILLLIWYNNHGLEKARGVGKFLDQLSKLGPTVYPLMFAFILGKAVKSFARWKMQQGERIGVLDLLYGSTTATGTISTIFELQTIGVIAIALILMWSLSPLGGQAMLRVLQVKEKGHTSYDMVPYVDPNTTFPDDLVLGDYGGTNIPKTGLFCASLASTTTQNSTMDQWGNIKIPMLEYLPGYAGADSEEWIPVGSDDDDDDSFIPTYSSLTGIPVGAIPEGRNSSFEFNTSYLHIDCHSLRGEENVSAVNASKVEGESFMWGNILSTDTNADAIERCNHTDYKARSLIYLGWDSETSGMGATVGNCTVSTYNVEVKAECAGWNCTATHLRPWTGPQGLQSNFTVFDSCTGVKNLMQYFFQPLRKFTDSGARSATPSLIQGYLYNPKQTFNSTATLSNPPIYTIGKDEFSIRLAQLINTYWLSLSATGAIQTGHPAKFGGGDLDAKISQTNATIRGTDKTIYYDKAWMGVLILSTLVLLLVAVAGLIIDLLIWVPRLMMNVSTLTRGNPNFSLPSGGGALADEDRSRILRDVKVRFGVAGVDGENRLVIGECAEEGGFVSGANKGKAYL